MTFNRYQHLERYGTPEVEGIEQGTVYIFPKLDGTNGQIWQEEGVVIAGSRNRQLGPTLENDNQGFLAYVSSEPKFREFFKAHPTARLIGEWLKPHTLRTYYESAWNKFYVFDVMVENTYTPYEKYKGILDDLGIDYIPAMCKIEYPQQEVLFQMLERNTFLIQDGKGIGEGIVLKRYDYVNRFGRTAWAKIVTNEFKAKHNKSSDVLDLKQKDFIESKIVDKYVTLSLVEKERDKIVAEVGWSKVVIPRLLGTVYYTLLKEEAAHFVKDFKFPVIDFKRLNSLTSAKIKELLPELFVKGE